MFTLSVKTRGNANPQGKQRVYFCCQEDDFGKYFESISNEILEKQNCAVYYLDPTEKNIDTEELFSHLSQMQLFVMPVTTKLLTTKNRALDVEFPFAIEKHIPVLPLMQEGGLEEIFNKRCGDLQFLDKDNRDETAISYDEKLDKFLSSVLVGDELAKKVRDAFDAYVFLSYRKKDRKYAQELMRLIHENDFCRDVAIWYDEFLTPGENFNDLIRQALEKSELFALAVTPNLVNEENYVQNVEYPMAVKEGKKVLPAELVPTDREELKHKYPGIENSTDAHDKEALSKALLAAFEAIAVRENDGDPEHNFFIGLAYLNGIDVEVNHERAVALITQAAESGVIEATEKLVSMYRSAEGVARSYETAIEWQEKLVRQREKKYKETGEEQDCRKYIVSLLKLGDFQKESDKIQKAENAYILLRKVCETSYQKFQSIWFKRYIVVSLIRLGFVYQFEGAMKNAMSHYEKALEIVKSIAEADRDYADRKISECYKRIGTIYEAEGELNLARDYFEKSLEANKHISLSDLAESYEELGNIAQSECDFKKAHDYYEKALEMRKKVAQETATTQAESALASAYSSLGHICQKAGNLKSAREYYEECLKITKKIAEETGTLMDKQHLSASYSNLSHLFLDENDLKSAKKYCMKSIELSESLVAQTKTPGWKRFLAHDYSNFADICRGEGDYEAAREYYEKAFALRKKIVAEMPSVVTYDDLAKSYFVLAGFIKAHTRSPIKDKLKAWKYYLRAHSIWSTLAEQHPDNPEYIRLRDLANEKI